VLAPNATRAATRNGQLIGKRLMTLIDEINRLFDELVRSPWSRPRPARTGPLARETRVDLEVPFVGGPHGDVSIALEGRRLTVRARSSRASATGESAAAGEFERSFVLPEGATVEAIEARVEDNVLRVRVHLRNGLG
jgi:HSP20 family molecular chaperone IbpA